jgi:hypothetical protein
LLELICFWNSTRSFLYNPSCSQPSDVYTIRKGVASPVSTRALGFSTDHQFAALYAIATDAPLLCRGVVVTDNSSILQYTLKCNTLKGKAFVSLSICLVNSTEPRGSIAAYVHDARAKIYGTLHATTTTALELAQRCEEENTTSVGLCVCVNVGGVVRIRVRTMQPASKQAKKKTGDSRRIHHGIYWM